MRCVVSVSLSLSEVLCWWNNPITEGPHAGLIVSLQITCKLFACVSICLSACLSVCLFIYICLSVCYLSHITHTDTHTHTHQYIIIPLAYTTDTLHPCGHSFKGVCRRYIQYSSLQNTGSHVPLLWIISIFMRSWKANIPLNECLFREYTSLQFFLFTYKLKRTRVFFIWFTCIDSLATLSHKLSENVHLQIFYLYCRSRQ